MLIGINNCILTLFEVKQIVPCNFNYALQKKLRKVVALSGSCGGYNLLYYRVVTQ
jgi:hypothetical protein